MSIFNELYMTSLATGHSPVLDKDIKSLSPPYHLQLNLKVLLHGLPKCALLLKLNFASFRQLTLQGGLLFTFFIPFNHNPLATCFATLLGGYSLDSFKSNFTNTPISQQMDVDLVPGVG